MTITIDLGPEDERRLSQRAARAGQGVGDFVLELIRREVRPARDLDEVLAPIRRDFERSGMTEEGLDALVEEAREEIWREMQASRGEAP